MSCSQPLFALPSQVSKPDEQVATAHAPVPSHAYVAVCWRVHALQVPAAEQPVAGFDRAVHEPVTGHCFCVDRQPAPESAPPAAVPPVPTPPVPAPPVPAPPVPVPPVAVPPAPESVPPVPAPPVDASGWPPGPPSRRPPAPAPPAAPPVPEPPPPADAPPVALPAWPPAWLRSWKVEKSFVQETAASPAPNRRAAVRRSSARPRARTADSGFLSIRGFPSG